MNIYLIPHTWMRHIAVSLNTTAAAVITWWLVLFWIVGLGPSFHRIGLYWSQSFEGLVFMSAISGSIAATSVLAEGSLRRRALRWRVFYTAVAGLLAFSCTAGMYTLFRSLVPYLSTKLYREIVLDPSLVTFRFTVPVWAIAGAMSGFGAYIARKLHRFSARAFGVAVDGEVRPVASRWSKRFYELFFHTTGGMVAGVFGGCAWHILGQYDALGGDLYFAASAGAGVWGLLHGLLCWPIPAELYAGWVRVLSPERYGLRIPVDHSDGRPSERFVGHFPRGLDLYMPAERSVAELHTSFVVDDEHNYAVRGLSVQPTIVKRFLETINLAYDPRRPAPLETGLKMGDRILMGEGQQYSEVEFIMLPKEEL